MFNGRPSAPIKLGEPSLMIGASDLAKFETRSEKIPSGSRLYVYSDGVTEIDKRGGGMLDVSGLIDLLSESADEPDSRIDRVLRQARALQGSPDFRDDFSLVEVEFS